MRTGLLLGAGGVAGAAYLAGALTTLEQDLGWDPRAADVIIGTSAGALIGALLRRDVPASDLAAWAVGAPVSEPGRLVASLAPPEFDPVTLRQFLRVPRRPQLAAVATVLRRPWRFDAGRAVMTHVADGERVLGTDMALLGRDWPDRAFRCCAVRRNDGRRVAFGVPDRDAVSLSDAVSASCAVPGYFAPVDVEGNLYIDGGVASPTNADRLRHEDLELAIVLAPMSSRSDDRPYSFDRIVRAHASRLLEQELRRVPRSCKVVVFAPGPAVLDLLTLDWMSAEHVPDIVGAAFLETGEQLCTAVPASRLVHTRRGDARLSMLAA